MIAGNASANRVWSAAGTGEGDMEEIPPCVRDK